MSSTFEPQAIHGKAFTILGAGTLGRRIALMWLTQGGLVHLFDSKPEALQSAQEFIEAHLSEVLRNVVHNGKAGTLKTFTDRSEALDKSWIVTEAVPEILDLKIDLLGKLDEILPLNIILATNSSSYTPSEMSGKVKNKSRLVATHYYMPPEALPVEIMPTADTDSGLVALLLKEAAAVGLKPFHVRKESVGLIANRIWAAIKRECLYVAAEGVAEPAEIDELFKLALGNVALNGPFKAMDQVGLDVVLDIERHYAKVREGQCPPQVRDYLSKYVERGTLGSKTGQGFFEHHDIRAKQVDKLIYLDIIKGTVQSISTDGTGSQVLVDRLKNAPDGVQVDVRPGQEYIYWTTMGPSSVENNGAVWRCKLDGSEAQEIVHSGHTFTPKQIHLDVTSNKLYWCDREGGRIYRSSLDGSGLEALYDSAPGEERPLQDATKWCVGITFDPERSIIYWTQKGASKGRGGRIFRAKVGSRSIDSTSIETLLQSLPEPIDLEIDVKTQTLYWTDRGDPPFGNSLNKFSVSSEVTSSSCPPGPSQSLIVASRFHETIGLALDLPNGKAYVSDLLGSLWVVDLASGMKEAILSDVGNFTGLTLVKAQKS